MRVLLSLLCALMLATGSADGVRAQSSGDRHVVLLSLDGLPATYIDDPDAPLPTLRRLAAQGARAQGMVVVNPSVTWPNHTTLVTGVRPERHGVLANGVIERPGLGRPVVLERERTQAELIHSRTLFDLVHDAGGSVAAVNWPCTLEATGIDDNFPVPPDPAGHATPRLVEELDRTGILPADRRAGYENLSPAARDTICTDIICHLIANRPPRLMLAHLINVDSVHHAYGPETYGGYSAAAFADACLGRIVAAVDKAGLRERTTFVIVSDHGFMTIPHTLQPNVVLKEAGLLTVEGRRISEARAYALAEGGVALLYLTRPDTAGEDRTRVIELFSGREGIRAVLTPDDFEEYGLPQPDLYPQMADLVLAAEDGHAFSSNADDDQWIVTSGSKRGTHGFLSTNPKMNAIFIASGAGIREGVTLGVIDNVDVAPTLARLLGVALSDVQGQVLEPVLSKP